MKLIKLILLLFIILSSCNSLPITYSAYHTPKQNKSLRKFSSIRRKHHNTPISKYGYINNPTVKKDTRKILKKLLHD